MAETKKNFSETPETHDDEVEVTEVETDDEVSTEESVEEIGTSSKEKGVLITVGIILLLLLIAVLIFLFVRFSAGDTYPVGIGTEESSNVIDSTNAQDDASRTPGTDNSGTPGTVTPGQSTDEPSGNGGIPSVTPPDTSKTPDTTRPPVSEPDNPDDGKMGESDTEPSSPPSDNDKDDDGNKDYSGNVNVSISSIDEISSTVTITADGESITVPLQTTAFNGRITKSGVAQGKLFGYSCGATVMLFYPKDSGFTTTAVNAWMERKSDSLTILVDQNGEGTKLLIKINGMKFSK